MAKAHKLSDRLPPIPAANWQVRPELLLHPNIPRPMHGMAPRIMLGDKWWNAERQAAYKRTDYHCEACGIQKVHAAYHKWLEGHETYAINYAAGTMRYVETVALCHFCHAFIHSGRLKALLDKGEIHHAKYASIIQHGDRVLQQAGLERVNNGYIGPTAAWNRWRLLIEYEGQLLEYPPIYKSESEWQDAHDL